jgi:hypothetical protein
MTAPTDPIREALPVVAVIVNRMDLRNVIQWTHKGADLDDGECLCRLSDAEAALKAKDAEIVALKADVRNALVEALSCIRWQSFGECRTPGHDGSPPAPAAAAKAIEVAIAALGGHGQ